MLPYKAFFLLTLARFYSGQRVKNETPFRDPWYGVSSRLIRRLVESRTPYAFSSLHPVYLDLWNDKNRGASNKNLNISFEVSDIFTNFADW